MSSLRIVCDTNVYLSAALRGGQAEALLQLAAAGAVSLWVSPPILADLDEKLQQKLGWPSSRSQLFLDTVRLIAGIVDPRISLNVVDDDPDDNRVLECAVFGEAALIVTYDPHLLRLKQYDLIDIVHPQEIIQLGLPGSERD
jgi:putative PIN family toxin of toxin-antitoxin system